MLVISQNLHRYRWSVLAISLLCSACGSGAGDGFTLNDGINSLSGLGRPVIQSDNSLGSDSSDQLPARDPLTDYVDCDERLPCVWSSADTGVIVTVERIGTEPSPNGLVVDFTIQTTRDTELQWLDAVSAVDNSGMRYRGRERRIPSQPRAEITGLLDVIAGTRIGVEQVFRETPDYPVRTIARFATGFIEAGVGYEVGFLNLPLGGDSAAEVDCQNRLPCSWTPENEEYSVTVVLADGLATEGRLTVHYYIDAYADIAIDAEPGSIAIGNEGTTFTPKLHTLGDTTDYRAFEVLIFEDATVVGSQTYFRTATHAATRLKKLTLPLLQVGATGGGTPVYRNVPVQ